MSITKYENVLVLIGEPACTINWRKFGFVVKENFKRLLCFITLVVQKFYHTS